jgi:hypothetical protein
MDTSSMVIAKGRALVDDPTYLGVGKIEICVFILLWLVFLLLKVALCPIVRR